MKKWIFAILSLMLVNASYAYDDALWANSNPILGSFCDVQTSYAVFDGYDGWCRLAKVKGPRECEKQAHVFAERKRMDEALTWQFVRVFRTYDPLAVMRADRYGVDLVEGETGELKENFMTQFSRYSDEGDGSIDKRLSCVRAEDVAIGDLR